MNIAREVALMNRPIGAAFGLPIARMADEPHVGVTVRPASVSGWLVFWGTEFIGKFPSCQEACQFAGQELA